MQNPRKRRPRKNGPDVVVLKNRLSPITQLRLARVQQLQSELAYYQEELKKEWKLLRREMLKGAAIERGPIRAFLRASETKPSRRQLVIK